MTNPRIPPARTPLVDREGRINPEWYRYLVSLNRTADSAAAGEVVGGDGLDGGGSVSAGVTLSLAAGGVENGNIRDALSCSVIGRFQNSAGTVADIQATGNRRVLARIGDQLVFTGAPSVPTLEVDTLRLTDTAASSTAAVSHSVPVTVDGTVFYMLLSATP